MLKHENLANFHLLLNLNPGACLFEWIPTLNTLSNNFELIHEETINIHFIGEISVKIQIQIQILTI